MTKIPLFYFSFHVYSAGCAVLASHFTTPNWNKNCIWKSQTTNNKFKLNNLFLMEQQKMKTYKNNSDGKVRMWRFTNTMKRQCSLENNSWQRTLLNVNKRGDAARLQNKILGLLSTAKSSSSSSPTTSTGTRYNTTYPYAFPRRPPPTAMLTTGPIQGRPTTTTNFTKTQHQKYKFKWFIYFWFLLMWFCTHNFN